MDQAILEKAIPKQEVRNGRIYEVIYGLETVTPPIPPEHEIEGYNLRKTPHLQKFRRAELPADWKRMTPAAKERFSEEMWHKRINGHWFYNNGVITYLPGQYWFELCWWHIDIGLKQYRDRDRRKAMFWRACVKDNNCFGMTYLKHRRDGATYWANCAMFETITRKRQAQGGIQSKTGKDAQKVFFKLVRSFRKLNTIFQPQIDGTSNPKRALMFYEPAEKQTRKKSGIKRTVALESEINFQTTNSEAYDGDKMAFYHMDECGKTTEADVHETWGIVKECLSTGAGANIVGKAMLTSTCAEMTKKGGANFKKIWDESNQNGERDANGQTTSGLYRLFLPAYDGLEEFVDEYGMSIIGPPTPTQLAYLRRTNPKTKAKEGVGAYQYLQNKRDHLKKTSTQKKLMEEKRLFPFNEKEAFAMPPEDCIYDLEKIQNRSDEIEHSDNKPYRIGKFVRLGENEGNSDSPGHGRVVFRESPNGLFKISRIGGLFKEDNDSNQVEKRGSTFHPLNATKFCGGTDPVDRNKPIGSPGSNAAAHAFRKHDALDPQNTHKFVCQYLGRPEKVKTYYNDMIKMCVYYGMQLMVENNRGQGLIQHFDEHGYGPFIMKRPASTIKGDNKTPLKDDGAPANDLTHTQIAELTDAYIIDHCQKVDFEETLEDWKNFNLKDTTIFDAGMSAGWTLIGTTKIHKTKAAPLARNRVIRIYNPETMEVLN